MIKIDPDVEVYALGKHICMSAHKARRVIDQIRGRPHKEALIILELMPYRACYPIFKLVYSAAANAIHNKRFNENALIISKAEVNEGLRRKKLKPRARGRSYPIKKRTCHITIVLQDISLDKNYFIWFRKGGWVYTDKYTDVRERYLCMLDYIRYQSENRMLWDQREVLWDKK
uniref:Large ribosomal subunit protein uL22c n=1 Tax=Glaucidium palmatum TaxID=39106 RepID=A0A481Y2B2_9MAGN|nr:ribosomal protein L22 [Glaucidium palmatum]QBK49888.1 ribosomal protein L22 [Glaucidium palmatum]